VTVTPKKDVSTFTVVSPEYHLEATTKLTPKDGLEQNLDLPVVQEGEIMTIKRLVHDFGPYIGWSQKVSEQGQVKKDFPTKKKEVTEDETTRKKKTKTIIEHHYKVVNTGKPQTIAFNLLGSRLNYPKSMLLTNERFVYLANSLGCEAAAIKALSKQETVGKGSGGPIMVLIKMVCREFYMSGISFTAIQCPRRAKIAKRNQCIHMHRNIQKFAVRSQVDLERKGCINTKDSVALQA